MITSLERITFQLLKSLASSWPTLSPSVIWIVMLSLDMVIKNQFAVWAKPNCHYWSLSWRGEATSKLLISSLSFKSQIGTEQHHLPSTYLNLSYCRISLCSASEMKPCESPSLWRFVVRLQVAEPVSDFLLVSSAGKTSSWKKKKVSLRHYPKFKRFCGWTGCWAAQVRLLGHAFLMKKMQLKFGAQAFTLYIHTLCIMVRQGKWTSGKKERWC